MGLAFCTTLAVPAFLCAQEGAAPAAQPAPPAQIAPADSMGALLSLTESEVVGAAEAMPADKYDFAPPTTAGAFKGVRSFGAQVRHIAQANYALLKSVG